MFYRMLEKISPKDLEVDRILIGDIGLSPNFI